MISYGRCNDLYFHRDITNHYNHFQADTGLRVLHFDVRQAGLGRLNAVLAFVDLSSDTIELILGQNHADSDVQLTHQPCTAHK